MTQMQVVYEGHYVLPGDEPQPNLLRLVVDYSEGAVFVVCSASRHPDPAETQVYRFYEPTDDDWRAGHGMAFDEARQHLEELIGALNRAGYAEMSSSPGWLEPAPAVFHHYLMAERVRHPLPMMH